MTFKTSLRRLRVKMFVSFQRTMLLIVKSSNESAKCLLQLYTAANLCRVLSTSASVKPKLKSRAHSESKPNLSIVDELESPKFGDKEKRHLRQKLLKVSLLHF